MSPATVNPVALGSVNISALDPSQQQELKKLDEAAKGFEQIFVQQMLKTADFGSKVGKGGYGSMAMEAMASGVTQGGGMGLATTIRDSMIRNQMPELASSLQPTSETLPPQQ